MVSLPLGMHQDYFIRVLSPVGNFPASGTSLTRDFSKADTTKGATLQVSKEIGGKLKEGKPTAVAPPPLRDGGKYVEIQGEWQKLKTIRSGVSVYNKSQYFVHSQQKSTATLYLLDKKGYQDLMAGKEFRSFLPIKHEEKQSFQILIPSDRTYFLVFSNQKELTLAVQSTFSLSKSWMSLKGRAIPSKKSPPSRSRKSPR